MTLVRIVERKCVSFHARSCGDAWGPAHHFERGLDSVTSVRGPIVLRSCLCSCDDFFAGRCAGAGSNMKQASSLRIDAHFSAIADPVDPGRC